VQQFQRNARVIVGVGKTALEITELRVRFECVKDQLSNLTPNSLVLEIYNLSKSKREKISKFGELVSLEVGYGESLRQLFLGKITHVVHQHEDTEWISTLYCWDKNGIGLAEESISLSMSEGTTVRKVIEQVVESGFGVAPTDVAMIGVDELASKKLIRGMSKSGPTAIAMNELGESYGFDWGFQDTRLEIRGRGKSASFDDDAVEISAATGMVGSPVLTDLGIEVTTLLNPAIRVWRRITIKSVGAGVRVGQIITRDIIPTLHEGTYIVGQVIFVGDTWSNDWLSKVKTFREDSGAGA